MDPVMKQWMYYNWLEDYVDEHKILENQGYLIGSFINPEAVRKALGTDAEKHTSTDEEFDRLSKQITEDNKKKDTTNNQVINRRRRKKFKE